MATCEDDREKKLSDRKKLPYEFLFKRTEPKEVNFLQVENRNQVYDCV